MTLDYSSIQQSRSIRMPTNGSAAECKVRVSPSLFPFYESAKRSNKGYKSEPSAIVVCMYVRERVSAYQYVPEKKDDWERDVGCMRERMRGRV